MGLAVLPARLKTEMALLKEAILNGNDFENNEDALFNFMEILSKLRRNIGD